MMTPDAADTNPLLAAALDYAARGWAVVPLHTPLPDGHCDCRKQSCDAVGKHPRTKDGLKSATTDPAKIRRWWGMWPASNIGIRTGEIRPGWYLSVLDVDTKAGGQESLENLEGIHGKLPDTRHSLTGGGGDHYVFEGDQPMKTTSGRLSSGLDTRGGGGSFGPGYIVAPPSRHRSGREYVWELSSPEACAPPPSWLLAMVNGPTVVGGRGPEPAGERIVDGQAGGAGRKKTLHSIGRTMRAREMTFEEILAALVVVNERRCDPPLDEKDVRRVAEHAARVPPGRSPEYEAKAQPREREPGEDDDQPPPPWWEGHTLVYDKHGKLKNTFANLCTVLRFAPTYQGKYSYDEMLLRPVREGKPMSDGDVGHLREELEKLYSLTPETGNIHQALLTVAEERRFHPVRHYLTELPSWDGVCRIDSLIGTVLKIGRGQDPQLATSLLRKWFISAVARAMKPGCKCDTALVLVGDQGLKKSMFFEMLAGPWFGDSRMDIENKDSVLQLHATWIYEWGEIEEITGRKQADTVKKFLSVRRDLLRPPYARGVDFYPRACVIVGTTNNPEFLNDPTGDRRFWIIELAEETDIKLLLEWRDALWAEALAAYHAGETWHLDRGEEASRAEDARAHHIHDPWEPLIAEWLEHPVQRHLQFFTTSDILTGALAMRKAEIRREHETRVGIVMRTLRWTPRRLRKGVERTRGYLRPGKETETDPVGAIT